MPKITNISPRGDLDVPLLRRILKRGETVDVTADQARRLLAQPGNFTAGEPKAAKTSAGGRSSKAAKAARATKSKSTDDSEVSK